MWEMMVLSAFPPASWKILKISKGASGWRPGWKLTAHPSDSWTDALARIVFFSKSGGGDGERSGHYPSSTVPTVYFYWHSACNIPTGL